MLHAQENRALIVVSVSDFWNICSEFTSKAIRSKNVLDSLELKLFIMQHGLYLLTLNKLHTT